METLHQQGLIELPQTTNSYQNQGPGPLTPICEHRTQKAHPVPAIRSTSDHRQPTLNPFIISNPVVCMRGVLQSRLERKGRTAILAQFAVMNSSRLGHGCNVCFTLAVRMAIHDEGELDEICTGEESSTESIHTLTKCRRAQRAMH